MSSSSFDTGLVFDSRDSIAAENFVHAVQQRAYAEGKDADNQWILRIVRASLSHDALRWHASLESEIQNDWALLQKAIFKRWCPTFRGIDGEECEYFIHSIRQRAFEEGRMGDNAWITQFMATRVVGDALRWHVSLGPEIQNNWDLLQQALLARYPPRSFRATDGALVSPASIIAIHARQGRIRVDSTNFAARGYLSRTLTPDGRAYVVQNASEALVVEYLSLQRSLMFRNSAGELKTLALRWLGAKPAPLPDNYENACIIAVDPEDIPSIAAPPNSFYSGSIHSDGWVLKPDGALTFSWMNSTGVVVQLFPRINISHRLEIFLAGSKCAQDSQLVEFALASFVFEDV